MSDPICMKSTKKRMIMNRTYLGLVHYPVYNKFKDTVITSITNLDIHDIARSCKTFGIEKYFIINPLETQKKMLTRVKDFWQSDIALKYNLDRVTALKLVQYVATIDDAVEFIRNQEKEDPILITTTALQMNNQIHLEKIRNLDHSVLILFGTGNGLSEEIHERADYVLEPIGGSNEYNHLSVRSAVAIILDRIFSEK